MPSAPSIADTRAAPAALVRLLPRELAFDRCLVVDDSDEDATQVLTIITERTSSTRNIFQEVQS